MKDALFKVNLTSNRIDSQSGQIYGLSVMTTGEAKGHGIEIDNTTLEQVAVALKEPVKVYLKHAGFDSHKATDVAGFLTSPQMDGNQIRANFQALDSFKQHAPLDFSTLFELAEKHPQAIGLSIDARGHASLAWKLEDGSEVLADWYSSKPANATGANPILRVTGLNSVDFVDAPAANPTGLFSKPAAEAVQTKNQKTKVSMKEILTKLSARFGTQPEALAKAVGILSEKPDATFEEVEGVIVAAQKEAQMSALEDENKKLKDEVEELKAKLTKLEESDKDKEEKMSKMSAEFAAKLEKLGKFHATDSEPKPEGQPAQPQLSAREKATKAWSEQFKK
jgi:hypothetical protein